MYNAGDDTTGFLERMTFSFGQFQLKNFEEECLINASEAIDMSEVWFYCIRKQFILIV